jgi:hypothetical protein
MTGGGWGGVGGARRGTVPPPPRHLALDPVPERPHGDDVPRMGGIPL